MQYAVFSQFRAALLRLPDRWEFCQCIRFTRNHVSMRSDMHAILMHFIVCNHVICTYVLCSILSKVNQIDTVFILTVFLL